MLSLAFDFSFEDLYSQTGLARLDARFIDYLADVDAGLSDRLRAARSGAVPAGKEHSELLLALAPHVEDFIVRLFGIETAADALRQDHSDLEPLFRVKRFFVQRRAAHLHPREVAEGLDDVELLRMLALPFAPSSPQFELAFARAVLTWEADSAAHATQLRAALDYSAWALHSSRAREVHGRGTLFQVPQKTDPLRLIPLAPAGRALKLAATQAVKAHGHRDGFDLTDNGCDLTGALDQANYCIGCHNQGKDSCSHGLKQGTGEFRRNPLGVLLTGCPLEERISEFLVLKAEGRPLAALAMIMLDNPMVAATGHRICNDCMKACIYQKQQPVDIPQ
ncbi:MAG: pyridine nucleotide-disulfide oxidoreductase, partial [Steroidobacteraceae bacterium]